MVRDSKLFRMGRKHVGVGPCEISRDKTQGIPHVSPSYQVGAKVVIIGLPRSEYIFVNRYRHYINLSWDEITCQKVLTLAACRFSPYVDEAQCYFTLDPPRFVLSLVKKLRMPTSARGMQRRRYSFSRRHPYCQDVACKAKGERSQPNGKVAEGSGHSSLI